MTRRRTRLVWTAAAAADLQAIHSFIAADSLRYATLTIGRLVRAVGRVRDHPESGRVVPEIGRADVREVIHGAYRIVYRLRGDTGDRPEVAEVLTVFRGSRRFPDLRLE